jgi:hypothetical protein
MPYITTFKATQVPIISMPNPSKLIASSSPKPRRLGFWFPFALFCDGRFSPGAFLGEQQFVVGGVYDAENWSIASRAFEIIAFESTLIDLR